MLVGSTELRLKRGDITHEEVDVIVNAANTSLLGGGGVDGAIHRAGGPEILAECQTIRARQGGCPTGQAVITGAGRLKALHVVHTVGPVWNGGTRGESDLLRACYQNSLYVAAHNGARTIAFPSISTGIYGYPIQQAASLALSTVMAYAMEDHSFAEIRFILFSDHDLAHYEEALRSLAAAAGLPNGPWTHEG